MMRQRFPESIAAAIAVMIVIGCATPPTREAPSPSPRNPFPTANPELATPSADIGPIDLIEHATGATEIVLRFDNGPEIAISELEGEVFQPGPEFTLYGDGTAIFRDERAGPPPDDGAIVRANPFLVARLNEHEMQSLLRFALEEAGLRDALEQYATYDVDDSGYSMFTIRAGGIDKRIAISGSTNPFDAFADRLRRLDSAEALATRIWQPDRYWGNLFIANEAIGIGLLPDPMIAGAFPWPWETIRPTDFAGSADGNGWSLGRRPMSAFEVGIAGPSGGGGMIQRVYLRDPDDEKIYAFSLWPMLPDELDVIPTPPAAAPARWVSTTPGPLRIDGLATVVTDRLRVRSEPEVGSTSQRLEPLLPAGTMLFVIDGPVTGSGYDWYRVAPATFGNGGDRNEFRYWGDPGPIGWVASADHDGTPWIEGAQVACPEMADNGLSVIELLGPLAALSCYGDAPLRLRAIAATPGFADYFGGDTGPDPMYPTAYWSAPDNWAPIVAGEPGTFGTVLDPVRFPNGEGDIPKATDVDIVGHFDDGAAAACAVDLAPDDPKAAAITLTCRTTFVVTELVPFTGIDPG